MAIRSAMLMAAGLGTRLRPFTEREPKALFPLLGIPIAQFAVDSLARAGVKRVVANVHHHADRAEQGLRALDLGGADLFISDERKELLGSAGGLRQALPFFRGEPFFLVNADVLSDVDLAALGRRHELLRKSRGVAMTLAVFSESPKTGLYREIFLDHETGLINGFGGLTQGRPFFIGAAVMEPEALVNVPASGPAEFVPTILDPMIAQKKAGFFLTKGEWRDIGAPDLWLDAHLYLLKNLETGCLHWRWMKRIESYNRRITNGIWVAKKAPRVRTIEWGSPCYWDGEGPAPTYLGPNEVQYSWAKLGMELTK